MQKHVADDLDPVAQDPSYPVVSSLLSIAKSTRAFITLLLAEIDLHPGQDQLLDRLEFNKATSVSVLAEDLGVRPSTISKMLDRLIEKRLVCRLASDDDARRTLVRLTPDGLEAQAAVRCVWAKLEQDLTNAMEPEALRSLEEALGSTRELLSQRLRRLR